MGKWNCDWDTEGLGQTSPPQPVERVLDSATAPPHTLTLPTIEKK